MRCGNFSYLRKSLFIYTLLATFLPACSAMCASALLQGTLRYEEYFTPGKKSRDQLYQFEIELQQGGLWRIKTIDGSKGVRFREYSCDGSNIFQITHFATTTNQIEGKKHASATGVVLNGKIPAYDPSQTAVLWLAYASSNSAIHKADGRVVPIWSTPGEAMKQGFTIPVKAVWNHGLLAEMLFYSEGKVPFEIAPNEITYLDQPAPFDRGFLNARYRSMADSLFNEHRFTKDFLLEVFTPIIPGNSPEDTRLIYSIRGVLTNYINTPTPSQIPPPPESLMYVNDQRITPKNSTSVRYFTTNWLRENDPKVIQAKKAIEASRLKVAEKKGDNSGLVFSVAVIVSLSIAFSLFLIKPKKQNKLSL